MKMANPPSPSSDAAAAAPSKLLSYRYALVFWGWLGFINLYFQRVNLSVAMVAMVNHTATHGHGVLNETETCPDPGKDNNNTDNDPEGEFPWDQNKQSQILGAFFYGYLVMQIPGGWLSERFGAKWVFGLGTLFTSLFSLLMPIGARSEPTGTLLLVFRLLQGFCESVTTPSMSCLLGQWAPPAERSMMATMTYSGNQMGTIIGMPLVGILCKSSLFGGWPSVFYVYGIIGIIWFILWSFFCFDRPDNHPRISAAERDFIKESLGKEKGTKIPPTPWKQIFTSVPVWALIVTHTCFNWVFYTLLTETPSYLADILHFQIQQNAFLSALPYVLMWLVIIIGGQLADFLRRNYLSTQSVRRIFNSTGMFCQLLCLLGLAYVGCNRSVAVFLLVGATGFSGFAFSGYMSNHLDIAPDFAGILMGLTNCIATIPGFLGPLVVGQFTTPHPTIHGWQNCFFVAAAICGVGAVSFLFFAAGETQSWAKSSDDDDECLVKHDVGAERVRTLSFNKSFS